MASSILHDMAAIATIGMFLIEVVRVSKRAVRHREANARILTKKR